MSTNFKEIHKSHEMTRWYNEVLRVSNEPEFYPVRHCKKCFFKEAKKPTNHIVDMGLYRKCEKCVA